MSVTKAYQYILMGIGQMVKKTAYSNGVSELCSYRLCFSYNCAANFVIDDHYKFELTKWLIKVNIFFFFFLI